MRDPVLCGRRGGALQAEVVWGQRREGLVLGRFGCLRDDWGVVKNHPQTILVVIDRIFHTIRRTRAQQELEVL